MFIDSGMESVRPPPGGPCADQSTRFCMRQSHIALLTEGRPDSTGGYKHCPPGGGPTDLSEIN